MGMVSGQDNGFQVLQVPRVVLEAREWEALDGIGGNSKSDGGKLCDATGPPQGNPAIRGSVAKRYR